MTGQRVAHIMPWDGVGGTEHAALRIGNAVKDAGFNTTYFCLGSAPLVRDFFSSAGFDTDTWRPSYPSFNGYRSFLRDSIELAKQFRRRRISLVHCGDVPAGSYAALAGRLALTPVICHVRNRADISPRRQQVCVRVAPVMACLRVSGRPEPRRSGLRRCRGGWCRCRAQARPGRARRAAGAQHSSHRDNHRDDRPR